MWSEGLLWDLEHSTGELSSQSSWQCILGLSYHGGTRAMSLVIFRRSGTGLVFAHWVEKRARDKTRPCSNITRLHRFFYYECRWCRTKAGEIIKFYYSIWNKPRVEWCASWAGDIKQLVKNNKREEISPKILQQHHINTSVKSHEERERLTTITDITIPSSTNGMMSTREETSHHNTWEKPQHSHSRNTISFIFTTEQQMLLSHTDLQYL